jgi:predicted lipoprotein with Yx(FWY)xxD motif
MRTNRSSGVRLGSVRLSELAITGAALALIASCSSGNSAGTAANQSAAGAATGTAASSAGSSAAVVQTTSGTLGTFLTDGTGRTLYLWTADNSGPSTCYDSCATAWPPLLTNGAPTASSGVDASKLGTTSRKDGTKQVTYNGNPLYYFIQDKAAGDTAGQGSNGFGAKWWVVSSDGSAITGSGGGGGASSSAGNGYTY